MIAKKIILLRFHITTDAAAPAPLKAKQGGGCGSRAEYICWRFVYLGI